MMNTQNKTEIDLSKLARMAMIERDLLPDFSEKVSSELSLIKEAALPSASPIVRDLRNLFWISIDNDDSLDLDQLTFAEALSNNTFKIYVAVADVDGMVDLHSAVEEHAYHNTTSIYTPTKVFPMLPPKLSTNLTSLNENEDRNAIIIEMDIDAKGQIGFSDLYPAQVRNHSKLAYNRVADWLSGKVGQPNLKEKNPEELLVQLRMQDKVAQLIKVSRYREGTLTFGTIELLPEIVDNKVVGFKASVHNRAHALIENFMISANVTMTRYFIINRLPVLNRIVRTPNRWDRIVSLAQDLGETLPSSPDVKALQQFLIKRRQAAPDLFPELSLSVIKLIGRGEYVAGVPGTVSPGHFDLALRDYAHTTAPNRRYPDLIMQRILKSHFFEKPIPYSHKDLDGIAEHCTLKEDDATKVERRVKKSAIAMVLEGHIGKIYPALVTGSTEKGTWVRLLEPPIEGKLIQGFKGLDVGDRLQVKLVSVDVFKGYIDFVKV